MKCEKEKHLQNELKTLREEANRYCLTTDCVLTTADILRRMDLTVRPCDNFWRYSCGGWLREHRHEPVEHESWGVQDDVEAKIRQYIRQRMGSSRAVPCDAGAGRMTSDCKMRLLYSRCMDVNTLNVIGARPLQDILDEFGGWSAHPGLN